MTLGLPPLNLLWKVRQCLFKSFANIDVFDLELDCNDPDKFIEAVESMAPTFGGINLEDIKAPECFYIEDELKKRLDIPVFHDDQHGTAIIAAAALINALELVGKSLDEIKMVVSGAGASALASIRLLRLLGISAQNILLCDSKGVIYKGRTEGMNPHKEEFAVETSDRTLNDAISGADVFFWSFSWRADETRNAFIHGKKSYCLCYGKP